MAGEVTDVDLVRFRLDSQEFVIVEVEDRRPGAVRVGARDRLQDAQKYFEENLTRIRDATRSVLAALRDASEPDEIKLTFGIKFTTGAGAVIARTDLEGNIGVELLWKRPDPATAESPG